MSIIIKTMTNLPDHCYDCPCHDGDSGYCQADEEHRYSDYRPFWCPLVETKEEEMTIKYMEGYNAGFCHAQAIFQKEPKPGYWVEEIINRWGLKVFCSECGCSPPFEYVSDGDVYSANGHGVINKTKFCPNCGARMIDPKENHK